ncbi:MAG: LCP family protein [Merismopedia sp. SIO2A8]|nr:LCP family protein [Merismopedia sp. SIO2A8]
MTQTNKHYDSLVSGNSVERGVEASHPKRFSLVKGVLWGSAFMVTAVASATIGAVVGLMVPLAEAQSEQPSASSIVELWRKGVRHQVVRPVNILVMGIDEVSKEDAIEVEATESDSSIPLLQEQAGEPYLDSDESAQTISQRTLNQIDANTPVDPSLDAVSEQGDNTSNLDQFAGRSDAMLLIQLHPEDQTVNVLSIPRDTQVEFPGRNGVTKINHANLLGGPWLAAKVIHHNFNGVEIDRYVRINTSAFRDLVDALGGVDVDVPRPMKYTDQTQGLYIDLEEGAQRLTGEEAEQFARFRSDAYGDIGRVQRQQQLIRALRDRVMNPTVIPRIPSIVQLLRDHIDTNLTMEELLALLNFSLDLERDDFRMVMLPGTFSQSNEYIASYWLMDKVATAQVMENYFHVSPPGLVAQLGLERRGDRDLKALRIAVQNASSDPSVTREVIQQLRAEGFTQVYRGVPWSGTQAETHIIVQRGNLQGAELIKDALSQGTVVSASTGDLTSDLTIRIGDNWHLLQD